MPTYNEIIRQCWLAYARQPNKAERSSIENRESRSVVANTITRQICSHRMHRQLLSSADPGLTLLCYSFTTGLKLASSANPHTTDCSLSVRPAFMNARILFMFIYIYKYFFLFLVPFRYFLFWSHNTWLPINSGGSVLSFFLSYSGWHTLPSHASAEACLTRWPNAQPQGREV